MLCVFSETSLLVNISNAVAIGYIKPWIPQPKPADGAPAETGEKGGKGRQKSPKRTKAGRGGASDAVTISPEATPDLQKAVEVIRTLCFCCFQNK